MCSEHATVVVVDVCTCITVINLDGTQTSMTSSIL